jgi:hypothetical protein
MKPICCPETSGRNYHYSLPNNPEARSYHPLRDGSLKSHKALLGSMDIHIFCDLFFSVLGITGL